jgi:aminoglycoside 3-N-acetyltransferase
LQTVTIDGAYIRGVLPFAVKAAQDIIDNEANINSKTRPGTDHIARLNYFTKGLRDELEDFRRAADIPEIAAAAASLSVPADMPDCADETAAPATPVPTPPEPATQVDLYGHVILSVNPDEPTAPGYIYTTLERASPGPSAWLGYAEKIVAAREATGFPYDLVNLPYDERGQLPFNMIYGPYANVLSLMDGSRNLAGIIREVEWETHRVFTENETRKMASTTLKLGRGKYLSLSISESANVTQDKIAGALRSLGVGDGDTLLVHSSATGLGFVEGGPDAALDGLLDAVGPTGNIVAATFTAPYIGFEGETNKSFEYRPFVPGDTKPIWTGLIPKTLASRPGAVRSAHATHSWTAAGPDAHTLTEGHDMLGPPASSNSPMAKALAKNGKLVFIGCSLASNTFLHFLEDMSSLTYLQNAIVKIKDAGGTLRTAIIPRNLPGHRDFYRHDAANVKFYRRAVDKGLDIRTASLGAGKITVISLQPLYEIGMRLIAEDKRVLLCDKPDCLFCTKYST